MLPQVGERGRCAGVPSRQEGSVLRCRCRRRPCRRPLPLPPPHPLAAACAAPQLVGFVDQEAIPRHLYMKVGGLGGWVGVLGGWQRVQGWWGVQGRRGGLAAQATPSRRWGEPPAQPTLGRRKGGAQVALGRRLPQPTLAP